MSHLWPGLHMLNNFVDIWNLGLKQTHCRSCRLRPSENRPTCITVVHLGIVTAVLQFLLLQTWLHLAWYLLADGLDLFYNVLKILSWYSSCRFSPWELQGKAQILIGRKANQSTPLIGKRIEALPSRAFLQVVRCCYQHTGFSWTLEEAV